MARLWVTVEPRQPSTRNEKMKREGRIAHVVVCSCFMWLLWSSMFSPFTAVIAKAEGVGEDWHGHVSAVTVAPEYRRLGLAKRLMDFLEEISEKM